MVSPLNLRNEFLTEKLILFGIRARPDSSEKSPQKMDFLEKSPQKSQIIY
jgi:hypothetical protein